jgi:hypothetical protein
VQDRKLLVNDAEAASVRRIFQRFVELGSATVLARELRRDRFSNKQGTLIDKGYLYRLLNKEFIVVKQSTRARLIRASTTPSSTKISGIESMPSCRKAPANGPTTAGHGPPLC